MLRSLSKRFLTKENIRLIANGRSFLSEAYRCDEAWRRRLESPVLRQVRLEDLYNELERTFQLGYPVSAIDMDVFTNAIRDDKYLEELRDLLHKLRLTPETGNTLPSTHYAVARNFMEANQSEELLTILDDRLNYGIFLDEFTANIFMDRLMRADDFAKAARVAHMLMLQEQFDNAISAEMALFACFKHSKSFQPEVPVEAPKAEEAVAAKPTRKKKVEEIKVRVHFLRNPYYDDHFDIRDDKLLTGKTLTMICSRSKDALDLNLQLIGFFLHNKSDEALKIATQLRKGGLYEETLQMIQGWTTDLLRAETCAAVLGALEGAITQPGNIEKELETRLQRTLDKHQEQDVHKHSQVISNFEAERETELNEHLTRLEEDKIAREKTARERALKDIDEKLWFFENEEKVELKIESKKVYYPKRWFRNKKVPRAIDEGYIPPEVQSRKS